jgi:hypothetical protein
MFLENVCTPVLKSYGSPPTQRSKRLPPLPQLQNQPRPLKSAEEMMTFIYSILGCSM